MSSLPAATSPPTSARSSRALSTGLSKCGRIRMSSEVCMKDFISGGRGGGDEKADNPVVSPAVLTLLLTARNLI